MLGDAERDCHVIATGLPCDCQALYLTLIRLGRRPQPIKFILPRFVSYLGERGVLCVGNSSHFCTPVFMIMFNTTFQVLMLSSFVFNKCPERNNHDYICG